MNRHTIRDRQTERQTDRLRDAKKSDGSRKGPSSGIETWPLLKSLCSKL